MKNKLKTKIKTSRSRKLANTNFVQIGMLGNDAIYPQQVDIAQTTMGILLANEAGKPFEARTPVWASQPQSGKTGSAAYLVFEFINDCNKKGLTFQIVFLCGMAATDLREQTKDRMTTYRGPDGKTRLGANLHVHALNTDLACYGNKEDDRAGLVFYNNTTKLKDVKLPSVDRRLVILDEAHLGNIKGSSIDTFLRNHGIKVSEQIHTWDNSKTRNHLVCISATPFAHAIFSDAIALHGRSLFQTVYVEPGKDYNSIENMLKSKRLQQTSRLFDGRGDPTTFLLEDVIAANAGKNGYVVLRAVSKQHELLTAYLCSQNFTYEEFNVSKENIHELVSRLAVKPDDLFFVLIKGSMRAGMTIPDMSNILAWVETPSVATVDAPTQSGVGRACGYGKTKDTFPIYCNVGAVRESMDFYVGLRDLALTQVPAGRQNTAVSVDHAGRSVSKSSRVDVVKVVSWEEGAKLASQAKAKAKARIRLDKSGKKVQWVDVCTTAGNRRTNVSQLILDGHSDGTIIFGMKVNGPPERPAGPWDEKKEAKLQECRRGYFKLIRLKPEWKDKFLVYKPVDEKKTARDETTRKTSALQKD